MVLSYSQLRSFYGPHCTAKDWGMELAYSALDQCLKAFKYSPRALDTGSYNCRPVTGGTTYSMHAYRDDGTFVFWTMVKVTMALAVDINWQSNPYGPRLITDMPREMVDAILAIRTKSGKQVWAWGGYYSGNKDAMHFEIVCSPSDLRSGIDPATLPSSGPVNPTNPPQEEEVIKATYMKRTGGSGAVVAHFEDGRNVPISVANGMGFSTFEEIYVKTLGVKIVDYVKTEMVHDGQVQRAVWSVEGKTADVLKLPA